MSVVPVAQVGQSPKPPAKVSSSGRWILGSWQDQLLIVSTPLLVAPVIFFVYSPWVGIRAETIGLIVAAFFALGHHLPGMIRAYGDRDLFDRFKLRFILTPPILLSVFFPLYHYHFELFRLSLLVWATWHGLMQLYGFVRIYDIKTGSISPVTAYWDWLMCLCWFVTAELFSPGKMSNLLEYWYMLGGALIPPIAVHACRWVGLTISIAVLIGFLINHIVQSHRGPQPNPVKLLMLASGIGFWWFAVVFVKNIVLGVALFDIAHDVQYLAIVWLYNCRRVNSNPNIGRFMKFVFRRGMVLLYVGLVVAYGAIGLVPSLVEDETVKTVFSGILWTSTILHYYYDGFIWKVRESATRASLGLNDQAKTSRVPQLAAGGFAHLLKWSPVILLLGWLFLGDLTDSSLSATTKTNLKRRYEQSVSGSTSLPSGNEEKSWLYSEFERAQNIAAAVPGDQNAQLRAAVLLANFGKNDEAISLLQEVTKQHPDFFKAYRILGEIHVYRGEYAKAEESLETAILLATEPDDRANANFKLGEVFWKQQKPELAEAKFQEALKDGPNLEAAVEAVRKSTQPTKSEK